MGQKREAWVIWGCVLVIICFVAIQREAHGETGNWKFFLSNSECDHYYNSDTVSRSPERIIRVTWKEVFKTKEVLKSRGFTGSEYEKIAYQLNVTELNCPRKEWRRKLLILCSGEEDDTPCTIRKEKSDQWLPVIEEQPIGALSRMVCQ